MYRKAYVEMRTPAGIPHADLWEARCYVRRVRQAADGSLYVKIGRRFIFFDAPPTDCRDIRPLNFTLDTKITRLVS